MNNEKNTYRQIAKNTTLFGGVQVIQVFTTLIKGKLIAYLLGTAGMGINTLINSAIAMIVQLAGLGINFSAVRDVSQAVKSGDQIKQATTHLIIKRWVYFSVVLGGVIMIILAPSLSAFSFDDHNYTNTFIIASVVVIFTILNNYNLAILQGNGQLNALARSSILSAVVGLIFSLPCYYFFKIDGILPALICTAATSFFISKYFLNLNIRGATTPSLNLKETISGGSQMVKLGVTMMLATLIGTAVNYLINTYIAKYGSISDVGLYGAGNSITNQYVGVIFTAMAVDFFPRLSSVCTDTKMVNELVNKQSEIVILIICPILIIMMLSAPLLIHLLLSPQFSSITTFIYWAAMAMFFKAASFSVGYISFSKGDKKTFFLFEGVIGSLLILTSNILGYRIGGLTGIAQGILISYIIYLITVNLMAAYMYNFKMEKDFISIFFKLAFMLLLVLVIMLYFSTVYGYILAFIILGITLAYCYLQLNKRIGLKELIITKFRK